MAPKAKPKAKSKAKAEAKPEVAEPKAKAEAKSKAAPAAGSPAAGSGTAAVRQSKQDAAAAEEASVSSPVAAETPGDAGSAEACDKEAVAVKEAPASEKAEVAVEVKAVSPCTEAEADANVEAADPEAKADAAAEAKVETKADARMVDLSDIPDPWESVTDTAALAKIRKEEWEFVEIGDDTPSAPAHLAAGDADLATFVPTEAQRSLFISADFSGCSFTSISSLGGPLWLRALGLANNPLETLAGLSVFFPRLLSLDISFMELSGIDGVWEAIASCPRLRRLTVEGCSLASFEEMKPMPLLRALEAQDNALETIEDVEALRGRCPDLEELDLRENDVVTEGGYMKKVKALFPKLTFLDNQSQKAYVATRQDEVYKDIEGMDKEINAVDGMWKNEGCSCIEGNPCLEPATCKDWKNREAVAAEARKRKGLRDDFGKLL